MTDTSAMLYWLDSIIYAEHVEIDTQRGTATKTKIEAHPMFREIRHFISDALDTSAKLEKAEKAFLVMRNIAQGWKQEADEIGRLRGNKWQPIHTAPDGRNILVIKRIVLGASDETKFYEPEIAYRNGAFWFRAPGERIFGIPTFWMALPEAPK